MNMVKRRLFWRVYLTLIVGLLTVGFLIYGTWRVLFPAPWERMGELRIRLADTLQPGDSGVPRLQESVEQLGGEAGAQISVFGPSDRLLAAYGAQLPAPSELEDRQKRRRAHIMRLDLEDGRTVLARINPPFGNPEARFLILVCLCIIGVGLAAYPVTARLTRRLEHLRGALESWGKGSLEVRVPDGGQDEVADVGRTFNSAAARIEALLASQKALLANASHELRSPLSRLRMAVELWTEMPGEKTRRNVEQDLAEVDHLVEEILLASRLDHLAGTAVSRVPLDLAGLAAEEAARLGVEAEGDSTDYDGDPTLLRRLIRNLLENAVKHGGAPVEIGVGRKDGGAYIRVSDQGRGIVAEERERVFEPFYRPAGRSEDAGGWGLGLSLVRQIAVLHGGTVRCDANAGSGTVFVITLPEVTPAAQAVGA